MNFRTIAASLLSTWLLVLIAGAVQADTNLDAGAAAVEEDADAYRTYL